MMCTKVILLTLNTLTMHMKSSCQLSYQRASCITLSDVNAQGCFTIENNLQDFLFCGSHVQQMMWSGMNGTMTDGHSTDVVFPSFNQFVALDI
jgi:hypothetical protein